MKVVQSFDAIPIINETRATVINGENDPDMKKCTSC